MDFGLFNQFNIREGADYHDTLKEWLDLAVVAEKLEHCRGDDGAKKWGALLRVIFKV